MTVDFGGLREGPTLSVPLPLRKCQAATDPGEMSSPCPMRDNRNGFGGNGCARTKLAALTSHPCPRFFGRWAKYLATRDNVGDRLDDAESTLTTAPSVQRLCRIVCACHVKVGAFLGGRVT